MKTLARTRSARHVRMMMALPVAALALTLAACAGGSQRPTTEEVSAGLHKIFEEQGQGDLFTDEDLTCMSEALVESDVSDQDLANLAEGKDVQTSTDSQKVVTEATAGAAQKCLTP